MHKKDIQRYLRALKPEEYSDFKKYLESKYFKVENRERVITLYDHLIKKAAPKFEDQFVNNDYLSNKLKFSNIRNLKSILANALENFMHLHEVKASQLESDLITVKMLSSRHLYEEFNQYSENWFEELDYKKERSFLVVLYKALFKYEMYKKEKLDRTSKEVFNEFLNSVDHFYFLLKTNFEVINQIHIKEFELKDTNKHFSEISTIIEKSNHQNDIALKIYSNLLAFENDDTESKALKFEIAKESLIKNIDLFSNKEIEDILLRLQFQCYSFIRLGKPKYKTELLTLHKVYLDKELFKATPFFDHISFISIFSLAAELKQLDWCENYLEKYKQYLYEKIKLQTYTVCSAYLSFSNKNYNESLKLLSTVNSKDKWLTLVSRLTQIRCFYEANEFFLLDNFVKTYQSYIRRTKKFSETRKKRYLRFAHYVTSLVKLQTKNDKDIASFEKKLKADINIPYRTWIEEKFQEIKN